MASYIISKERRTRKTGHSKNSNNNNNKHDSQVTCSSTFFLWKSSSILMRNFTAIQLQIGNIAFETRKKDNNW